MTNTFEIIAVAPDGTVLEHKSVQRSSLRVRSDMVIPAGFGIGAESYVTDKVVAAVSNGNDTWTSSKGKTAAAGQTWAELC